MTDLRHDPLTGQAVILAASRADRPHEPLPASPPDPGSGDPAADCPFCPGHEHRTPPEVARVGPGPADGPGWLVRVFPNRFPIVDGGHEVVVLSPDHHRPLARLDDRQVTDLLRALQDRVRAHAAAGHATTQLLVNHGAAAGASLTHPHAQAVALDQVPPVLAREVARVAVDGTCLLCDELAALPGDPSLAVLGGDEVGVWCPGWSSTAYELLLAPRRHRPRFEDADEELPAVAAALRDTMARLADRLGDPPCNVYWHSLPDGATDDFHWHVHVRPRLQVDGGFELGTGIAVNTVDPAAAAAALR